MGVATLNVQTDWPVQIFDSAAGVGYWQITDGNPTDDDDFIVGGEGGLGIAPGTGNISHLVMDYSITRGRSSELDRVAAGQAVLTLDNPSAMFSPLNTSGSLSGSLLPGRDVQISWLYEPNSGAASRFYRFTGKLASISTEPTMQGGRSVVFTCIDDSNEMQRKETRSTLYQSVQSGCLVASLLDDAGFFATCRAIDDGQDNYRWAYFERRKLDEVLVDIERTEYGFMYIRGDGAFVFHNRHHRSSGSVSASFNNTMSGITYYRSDDDLATIAEVTYLPKALKSETTVWTLQDPLSIPAQTAASFFGNYLDPTTCRLSAALGVASPVTGAGTPGASFYSAPVASEGVSLNADFSASFVAFAESFKYVVSNGGSLTGYLTGLTVTGCPLVTYEQSTQRGLDATACQLYGERTLTYTGQNLINTSEKARDFAKFLVNRFKNPENLDDVTVVVRNKTETLHTQILGRELDDRIALTHSGRDNSLGIDGTDFFVGRISENWDVLTHPMIEATWQLERASTQNEFIVDISEVGGTDAIGY